MQTGQAMDLERMILDTLAQDIDEHPEGLQPVDAALVERLQRLVAGVELDGAAAKHGYKATEAHGSTSRRSIAFGDLHFAPHRTVSNSNKLKPTMPHR